MTNSSTTRSFSGEPDLPGIDALSGGDTANILAGLSDAGFDVDQLACYAYAMEAADGNLIPLGVNPDAVENDIDAAKANAILAKAGMAAPKGDLDTLYRLRYGVERDLIVELLIDSAIIVVRSELPVMWDRYSTSAEGFNHVPAGSNVLYMDGHVEFVEFPGWSPVSRLFAIVNN